MIIRKLLACLFVGVFCLMVGMNVAYASPGHDRGHGHGHHDHGNGHGRGHDKGGCPGDTPSEPSEPSEPATPNNSDAPVDTTVAFEARGAVEINGCDTSWERATFPECYGMQYELMLQNDSTDNVAVPVTRVGFDVKNAMTNHPGE